jgi:histidinol phosphatase-like enzyme (inositol monophosphatase family)
MIQEPEFTENLIATALSIVRQASVTSRGFFRAAVGVEFKADESPVTIADKTVEAEIRSALEAAFPGDGILGEEHGVQGDMSGAMWVVDPIDGTRSFISGNPLFGMLLGLVRGGVPVLGIVGMPALEEVYCGVPGQGAQLNGAKITTSDKTRLSGAILYINEGDKIFRDHAQVFERLCAAGQTRRMAYDCYPHALLAAGHVDVVVDYDLKPFDFLPVTALVQAAGGVMTDWQGGALDFNSDGRVVSAATPQLHAQILALLNEAAS